MTDVHPDSGSSYDHLAGSPMDAKNHPDNVLPDNGDTYKSDGTLNMNSFSGQYYESRAVQPMVDSMKFDDALSKLGNKK